MKKKLILVFFCFFALGIFFFKRSPQHGSEYVSFPVSFFPFKDVPTIKLKIEKTNFTLMIDSGASHQINLNEKALKKIKIKKLGPTTSSIGIRGKTYLRETYNLPPIKIQTLTVDNIIAHKANPDFYADAKTWDDSGFWCWIKNQIEDWTQDGSIGRGFFINGVAFFDFPHKNFMIAKDFPAWKKAINYQSSDFFKIPCKVSTYGVLLTIETDLGKLEFLLDSGATHSILHPKIFSEKMPNQSYTSSKLQIEDQDLGEWDFLLFNYTEKMEFDGVLGIDFFKKYSICIDFPNQEAYIKM